MRSRSLPGICNNSFRSLFLYLASTCITFKLPLELFHSIIFI